MEFVNLARYRTINKPEVILPFSELREMKPVWLTHDLQLVEDEQNLQYVEYLVQKGMKVAKIRREPPFAKYVDRNEFPRRILFEMTSKCNFLCRMCPQQDLTRPRMHMDGELYRRVIDEIDRYGVEGLWLYRLGESLLHPEFAENIIHVSSKKNLGVVWMSTNGRYFDEKYIRLVMNSNIDFINISVHAVSEEVYNTVAPKGNFQFVQDNVDKFYLFKKEKPFPSRPFMRAAMIEQETTKDEVDPFIFKHHDKADLVSVNMLEYVNFENNAFGKTQRDRKSLTVCQRVLRNDCFISSNGEVTLCDADYNCVQSLGNVNEKSLYEIWNGEKRMKMIEMSKAGRMSEFDFCSTCTDYDI